MTAHRMKVDVKSGKLIAACECGEWQREEDLGSIERPSETMQRLEEEHERHVAEHGQG